MRVVGGLSSKPAEIERSIRAHDGADASTMLPSEARRFCTLFRVARFARGLIPELRQSFLHLSSCSSAITSSYARRMVHRTHISMRRASTSAEWPLRHISRRRRQWDSDSDTRSMVVTAHVSVSTYYEEHVQATPTEWPTGHILNVESIAVRRMAPRAHISMSLALVGRRTPLHLNYWPLRTIPLPLHSDYAFSGGSEPPAARQEAFLACQRAKMRWMA